MSDPSDDIAGRLADLVEPDYVTVTVGEDGDLDISTNLETDKEVWTLLSAAMFDVAHGVHWGGLSGEDIGDSGDDE